MDYRPQLGELKTSKDVERLVSVISELADSLDTLYTTTAPNGNISARQGRVAVYDNSGTYSIWVNVDGSTTWQQVGMQYTDTRFETGHFTRDTAAASGNQTISGLSGDPKAVLLMGSVASSNRASWTFFMGGTPTGNVKAPDFVASPTTGFFDFYSAEGLEFSVNNTARCVQNGGSLGTNSFVITWTKVGSPTGTAGISWIAFY